MKIFQRLEATIAVLSRAVLKHGFERRALRDSSKGEKALVYVSTKPPSQAVTRSINRPPGLEPASSIDLQVPLAWSIKVHKRTKSLLCVKQPIIVSLFRRT